MKKDDKNPVGSRALPPPPATCTGQLYTVMDGDTLYLISIRFDVPLVDLINTNPQITNPNIIYPGQIICIPGELRIYTTGPLAIDPEIQRYVGVVVQNNSTTSITCNVKLFDKDVCPKLLAYNNSGIELSPGCSSPALIDLELLNVFFYEVRVEAPSNANILAAVYGLTETFGVVAANTLRHSELILLVPKESTIVTFQKKGIKKQKGGWKM